MIGNIMFKNWYLLPVSNQYPLVLNINEVLVILEDCVEAGWISYASMVINKLRLLTLSE